MGLNLAMNKYSGKICPYCKTPFTNLDEIVVCSVCDMPHHKDCWVDNQGCTTFGCNGTITSPSQEPVGTVAEQIDLTGLFATNDTPNYNTSRPIFCPRCGAENLSSSIYCCRCGAAISSQGNKSFVENTYGSWQSNNPYSYVQQGYYPRTNDHVFSISAQTSVFNNNDWEENMSILVGKNTEFYLPAFRKIKQQNKKTGWNWCAFLFSPCWFMYRKMYGYGIATLGAALLQYLIGGSISSLLLLGGYITIGIFGNSIYMDYLEKKLGQISMLHGQYKSDFAQKNGGTSIAAMIFSILGYSFLILLL